MTSGSDDGKDRPTAYEVGYRKPPVHTRFAKGQSGNPLGRPRKPKPSSGNDKPLRDRILKEGDRKVAVRDGCVQSEMSAIDAVRRSEFMSAIKGSPIAQRNFQERYDRAARELALEIEKDHAFWQHYCEKHREMERRGRLSSDELPHPDDLTFEDGKRVWFTWTPRRAEDIRRWITALILQAEKDIRRLRRQIDAPGDPKPLSLVFAIMLNERLSQRYRIDDLQLIMEMNRCRAMTKPILDRNLKDSWGALNVPYRKDSSLPATGPYIKPLAAMLLSSLMRQAKARQD